MARVTVEDCVDKVPNRFDLVLLSAQRARQISGGAELTIDRDRDKNPVVALREVAEQTVKPKELEEALVGSLQRVQVDEDDVADEVGSLSPVGRGAAPHRRGAAAQQQCGRRLRRLSLADLRATILQWTGAGTWLKFRRCLFLAGDSAMGQSARSQGGKVVRKICGSAGRDRHGALSGGGQCGRGRCVEPEPRRRVDERRSASSRPRTTTMTDGGSTAVILGVVLVVLIGIAAISGNGSGRPRP